MPIIKLFNHLIFLLIKFQTKNDKMKMTGVGRQKPLSIFDQLCLGFVREAKRNTAVDYISSVPEPSGSDQVSLPVNRKANMNEVTAPPLLPEPECPKKKKKIERETGESSSTWKKDFLDHVRTTDSSRIEAELKIFGLKEYNLILRNMQIEKDLGKEFVDAPQTSSTRIGNFEC